MKSVLLTFAVLFSFNFAQAASSVRAFVVVGTSDKFDENDFRGQAPNGSDAMAIDCGEDQFSSIEVDDLGRGFWAYYKFTSHKECLKAASAMEKATAEYPAVIVLINGVAKIAEH
ncbi:hypothetical protein [Bdellovibrio sp. HCB2-146]|uniref:hypothetical protein n=1 Tax=Bdellovibrio sp. HCB2-146 TaxID=3394362 RepID=UPI0039BC7735